MKAASSRRRREWSRWVSRRFQTAREYFERLNLGLLRRLAPYAKPYLGLEVIMFAAMLTAVLFEQASPLLMRGMIDQAIPQADLWLINLYALGMVVLPLARGLVGLFQQYVSARISQGMVFDLRLALYRHFQRQSLRFYTATPTGELLSRLNDVSAAQGFLTATLPNILLNLITLVTTLIIMFGLDTRLALVGLAMLPLYALPTHWAAGFSRRMAKRAMQLSSQMYNLTTETLGVSGGLLVKVFGRQQYEFARYTARAAAERELAIQQGVVGNLFGLFTGLTSALGLALVYWVGGYQVVDNALTIGTVVAFAAYLSRVYGPFSNLMNVPVHLASSLTSMERLFQTLDFPVEIADRPGARALPRVQGHIRLEHVYFCYPTPTAEQDTPKAKTASVKREWAVEDISLEIEPGQLAAFVGPSGSGKTTLTYLVPRLYDANHGTVYIDNHDVRDVTLASLAEQIGMVTQETYLFNDTIRANLLYANPNASEAELRAALDAAYLTEVIARLPEGLDTVAGQRGYRMSGGERQRLSIARIVLKNPRILILDEATSALDTESELAVQVALERLFQDRTGLVIAHRLSTIRAADVIFVLDDGRRVEQGTHPQLLAKGGLYAQLYQKQFKDQEGLIGIKPADILAFPEPARGVLVALLRLGNAVPQKIAAETERRVGDIVQVLTELEAEGHVRVRDDGSYELVLAKAMSPRGTRGRHKEPMAASG
ncbi:MAG: ABC transporter ATP-binding protein [Chloroflexi bacterium]|nr:ABC transporter ATP-binding protein [Chloroflexota bacterium]